MDKQLGVMTDKLAGVLWAADKSVALAESCTGGLIAAMLTEISGSSAWFERGFVTYSNAAKMEMLGVSAATLAVSGAVSSATALEMVQGVLQHSRADYAIAVTGIAGPSGGSAAKPVGTVFIAWGGKAQNVYCEQYLFTGDRHRVRVQTAIQALQNLYAFVTQPPAAPLGQGKLPNASV